MKIILCCREWGGSTGRYARTLVNYLQDLDNTNEYVVLLSPDDYDTWLPQNKNFTKMLCPYKDYSFSEQTGLKKMLDAMKPDLVHFTMTQQPIFFQGKTVTTMHDLTILRFDNPSKNKIIYTFKKIIYRFVCYAVAKKSVRIITPTSYVKTDIATCTGVKESKIKVISEGASFISNPARSIDDLRNKNFIMYVGRPNPHKNLENLIRAFAVIVKTYPNLHLVLAGSKDQLYERLEKKYEHVVPNIYFTGYISDSRLRWLYENCEAYIFPSLSEGFGLPGLEAMSHGAPVISSSATCLPEVYGDAAIYFDPHDTDDISNKIITVLSNQKLRNLLVKRGKKRAKMYSWKHMAIETLSVYKSALER